MPPSPRTLSHNHQPDRTGVEQAAPRKTAEGADRAPEQKHRQMTHKDLTDDQLLLETDYTSYASSCRDPHITPTNDLVECRRQSGHDDTHATRAGLRAIRWAMPEPHAA